MGGREEKPKRQPTLGAKIKTVCLRYAISPCVVDLHPHHHNPIASVPRAKSQLSPGHPSIPLSPHRPPTPMIVQLLPPSPKKKKKALPLPPAIAMLLLIPCSVIKMPPSLPTHFLAPEQSDTTSPTLQASHPPNSSLCPHKLGPSYPHYCACATFNGIKKQERAKSKTREGGIRKRAKRAKQETESSFS